MYPSLRSISISYTAQANMARAYGDTPQYRRMARLADIYFRASITLDDEERYEILEEAR